MPLYKNPLKAKCFQCKKEVLIKFVPPQKDYSKKNNWGYWTENQQANSKYICNICLYAVYKGNLQKFQETIPNSEKRHLLRSYIRTNQLAINKE